jgi:small subunit ribosomal protein S17
MAKKQQKGIVVSNKMTKTVVVKVERIIESKKYKKRYTSQKKYKADTREQTFNIGDVVLIQECKPISKDKRWEVLKRITESKLVDLEPISEEIEQK